MSPAPSPSYTTYVFDLDGTIADTLEASVNVYNQLAAENNYRQITPAELPELRHLTLKEFIQHVGVSSFKVPRLLYKGRKMLKDNIEELPLIDGMADMLKALRPHAKTMGVLTSNSTENATLFLKAHGLNDLFDFISSSTKLTSKAKNLRSICQTFSLAPAEIIYIGDETRDIKAAHKAGVASVAVSWGFNSQEVLSEQQPTHLCNTAAELQSTLID